MKVFYRLTQLELLLGKSSFLPRAYLLQRFRVLFGLVLKCSGAVLNCVKQGQNDSIGATRMNAHQA